jgi:predicted RNA-binding protein with PUA-like domain
MAFWLFKQEPTCYSYADLERDGATVWDGVANPLALKHLRAARPGDRVFYYHTGKEKAIVGIMEVTGEPGPDPTGDNPKAVVVPVKPVRKFDRPVTLEAIKADPLFAGWELIRMGRLSVMPVGPERWARVEELASGSPKPTAPEKRSVGKLK